MNRNFRADIQRHDGFYLMDSETTKPDLAQSLLPARLVEGIGQGVPTAGDNPSLAPADHGLVTRKKRFALALGCTENTVIVSPALMDSSSFQGPSGISADQME